MSSSPVRKLDFLPCALRRAWYSGDFADRYRVTEALGSGGMGHVVAGLRKRDRREVAIKFLGTEQFKSPHGTRRFFREARAAARITSPHAIRLFDRGRLDDGTPYLVMEYLRGITLADLVKTEGPLPVGMAAEYLLQASHAIAQAHNLGIIHRDIKPANLFVTRDHTGKSHVKVLDFGVSKLAYLGDLDSLTETGDHVGSPRFMAPEQLRSSKTVDLRADIWSLAVTLYSLLSCHYPFAAQSRGALIAQVLRDPPDSILEHRCDVPRDIVTLIEWSLQKDRSLRPSTVRDLAAALAPFAGNAGARLLEGINELAPHVASLMSSEEDLIETEGDRIPFDIEAAPASSIVGSSNRSSGAAEQRSARSSGADSWKRPSDDIEPLANLGQRADVGRSPSQLQGLVIVGRGDDHWMARWRNVLLVLWIGTTRITGAAALRDATRRMLSDHPEGFAYLSFLAPDARPPSAEVRRHIAQTMKFASGFARWSALVLEGSGFRAALVRSIVAGIAQLERFPYPHRVVSKREGIDQIAQALVRPEEALAFADELAAVVELVQVQPEPYAYSGWVSWSILGHPGGSGS